MSRRQGVTDAELAALDNFEDSDCFTDIEKAVLAYAKAMTQTPVDVPQALFDTLAGHFSPKQLVELTSAIGWENYRARFDHAFEIGSAGFAQRASGAVENRDPVSVKHG